MEIEIFIPYGSGTRTTAQKSGGGPVVPSGLPGRPPKSGPPAMQQDQGFILVRWTAEKRADGFYVIEKVTDIPHTIEYGPMPETAVEPLMLELKGIVTSVYGDGRFG